uniref:Uncharacterized protein n=1 Tax=Brassica campestris TaxID=3711 RepID=A0A3P6A142_BRACM|nr:unnamed protein product [Brassica rapa]
MHLKPYIDLVFTSHLLTVLIISISIVLHYLFCPDGKLSSTSLGTFWWFN